MAAGAPIDSFGVGTRMVVSADAPDLDLAYKLVSYEGVGRTKLSSSKVLYPGRKQVFREREGGRLAADRIGRHEESLPGEPLLIPVMEGGRRREAGTPDLEAARARLREQLRALPGRFRVPLPESRYPVHYSQALKDDLERVIQEYGD